MEAKAPSVRENVESRIVALKLIGESYNMDKEVKMKQLKDGVGELMGVLESITPSDGISAGLLGFWKGAALDYLPESSKEAEKELAKAVKLEPSLVDAWNALGNLYWRKGDIKGSKSCFVAALQQSKNAVSLRCLSMILRATKAETPQERLELVNESVVKAREAVGLETKDSESWYVLGNAYTTLFFCSNNDHSNLQKALKAYTMAFTYQGTRPKNPDLYFNRASVYKFTEDYALAVADYKQALELDHSFKCGPDIEEIQRLVAKLVKTISTKAGLKPRVLKHLTENVPIADSAEAKQLCGKRSPVSASALTEGSNDGKAVIMSFVMCVTKEQDIPVSVIALDSSAMVVVSLYNVAPGSLDNLKQGDLMCIMDPSLKTVTLDGTSYPTLQLSSPSLLVVNGKSLQPTAAQILNRPHLT